MDFTLKTYKALLKALIDQGFMFQTFGSFLKNPYNKTIILRHDVDLRPGNSLIFSKIQNELGIKGTYYFRAVPESWDEDIIKEISSLGHEIGYHYENLTTCAGDVEKAIADFNNKLEMLRKLAPVETICMHGSPRSKYDNRDLWEHNNYRDFGIIGEPYFDIDYSKVFYLTDTGRRWDGDKFSVRDRVESANPIFKALQFHRTKDIIRAVEEGIFPDQVMFTFHPQRWTDKTIPWIKELIGQNSKNWMKRIYYRK